MPKTWGNERPLNSSDSNRIGVDHLRARSDLEKGKKGMSEINTNLAAFVAGNSEPPWLCITPRTPTIIRTDAHYLSMGCVVVQPLIY